MPNLDKLKGLMVEKNKTYADGAKIVGCSVTSFSLKMNGKSNFTIPEANDLSNALGLSCEERAHIFLMQNLHDVQD
jgi:predicted transcriptional regulator